MGTPIDLEKMRSLGYLSRGRSRPKVTEGREHSETGRSWKTTSDDAGAVTEHNVPGERVDVLVRPESVHVQTGKEEDSR